ncbi:MAG: flagellar motor protein MotB [Bdellovibrionota bacterium]|nr:flagellar motor protein MotB [Bdellovibrionota bacterium]
MPKRRHADKVSSFDDDQDSGAETISKSSWAASYGDVVSVLLCFFIILSTTSNMNSKNVEKMKEAMSDETPQGKKKKLKSKDVMKKLKEIIKMKKLEKDVTLVEELDGTKLIIGDRLLFSSGGAILKTENLDNIRLIIKSFLDLPSHYRFKVEGHTDDVPMKGGKFPTNWHLSLSRALSLLKVFQQEGIYEKRLSFHGFASHEPLVKIDNLKGQELRAARKKNRRVVIKVY